MTVYAAVVDDEHIIAADLARQLEKRKGWKVVGAFTSPRDIKNCAGDHRLDVCFLDIEMPGTDGLALARELSEINANLLLVFATAYAQYAANAFRVDAIDYLVKPIDPLVLEETCKRIETRLSQPSTSAPERLSIISSGKVDFIEIDRILAVKAAGNYVARVTERGELLHRTTLTAFLDIVSQKGFIRTHRSYAIRPDAVVSASTRGADIVEVVLRTGESIPVSEAYQKSVTARLKPRDDEA